MNFKLWEIIYNVIPILWSKISFAFEAHVTFGNIQRERGLIFLPQMLSTGSVSEQVEDCELENFEDPFRFQPTHPWRPHSQ